MSSFLGSKRDQCGLVWQPSFKFPPAVHVAQLSDSFKWQALVADAIRAAGFLWKLPQLCHDSMRAQVLPAPSLEDTLPSEALPFSTLLGLVKNLPSAMPLLLTKFLSLLDWRIS